MDQPTTPALDALAAGGVPHRVVRTQRARPRRRARASRASRLDQLLRTIVVRRADDDYLFVLVPAGRRFDWPKLRALLGVSRMSLPDADEAQRVTGYPRGTITPFGSTRAVAGHRGRDHRRRAARGDRRRGASASTCTSPRPT